MLHTYLLRMLRRMTRWACSHSHYVHNDIEICWQFSDYVRHKPMISTYCASETYMYSILSPVLFGNVSFQFTEFYLSLLFSHVLQYLSRVYDSRYIPTPRTFDLPKLAN